MLNELFLRSPTTWDYDGESETKLWQLQEPFSDVVLHSALSVAWIEDAAKLLLIHGRSSDRDLLKSYLRTHLAPGKDSPLGRAVRRTGVVVAIPILSGLHYHYVRI
jgi:hypothetical protein